MTDGNQETEFHEASPVSESVSTEPETPKTPVNQEGWRTKAKNWLRGMAVNENAEANGLAAQDAIVRFDNLSELISNKDNVAMEDRERWEREVELGATGLLRLPAVKTWFKGIDSIETYDGIKVLADHYNSNSELHRNVTMEDLQAKVGAEKERLGIKQEVSA